MNDLTRAFNSYGLFSKEFYFTSIYKSIPSLVGLRFTVEDINKPKTTLEKIIPLVDVPQYDLKTVYKNWHISDYKEPTADQDYPNDFLFASQNRELLIGITISPREVRIDFHYQTDDANIEAWVLDVATRLRNQMGKLQMPSFNILARSSDDFYTERVEIKDFGQLDIDALYNDDFKEIDQTITASIQESRSGLILLHGKPGTGKTTYIKNLLSKFNKRSFIFIQNDLVPELLKPAFISFLLKHKDSILIIEDAEKVVVSREVQQSSVVSTILQLTDGLFSDYLNIKVICSFNTGLDKIDKALLRKGRMIARYEFEDLVAEKADRLLRQLGYEAQNKPMSLAEIYKIEDRDFEDISSKPIGFR
ncbi:MAG: AAA family ATPase [Bacteroidota bacterium]